MGRRLGEMLAWVQLLQLKDGPLFQVAKDLIFLFLIVRFHINRHKIQLGGRCGEQVAARPNLYRGGLIYGRRHTAGCKPLPD